jgi:hypothetical protein
MSTAESLFKSELPDMESIQAAPSMAQLEDRAKERGVPLRDIVRAEQDKRYKAIQNSHGIPTAIVICRNPWVPVAGEVLSIGVRRYLPIHHCFIAESGNTGFKSRGGKR